MAKNVTAHEYISRAIEMSPLTQREIATMAGYDKPNVISMMKTGITKVPINKIPVLAKACGVDEKHMLRVVMQDYYPEVWEVLMRNFETESLNEEERELIRQHRASKDESFVKGSRSMPHAAADSSVAAAAAIVA